MTLKRMTSLVAALALLALVVVPAAAGDDESVKFEEKFQQTEKLALDGKVYLKNISGNIKVLTWNKEEVNIDALKVSKAGTLEKAKENAALVKIEVSRNDGRLEILTKYPEGSSRHEHGGLNVSVTYNLTVPAKAEVEIRDVSGNVSAENIGGYAKLESVSGDVVIVKAAKGGVFNTVSGDVNVSDISGDLKIKAVSGDITLTKAAGSVNAETVSGDVELKGLSGAKSVDINVLSGDVTFDGVLEKDGRYSFQSHSGDITVTLPESAAFDFSCKSFSGDISSDFKVIVEMMGSLKHGQAKPEIRGQVNGGGADLSLTTFSGDINLKKR
jgi:DUF4097 and DUF4098 domain-containing protein YvlB